MPDINTVAPMTAEELDELLAKADELVRFMALVRRPYGYVFARSAEADRLLEGYLRLRDVDITPPSAATDQPGRTAPQEQAQEGAPTRVIFPGSTTDRGNHDCLAKALSDEPKFVILGRDPDGATIVDLWADRREAAGGDAEHVNQVRLIAESMREWRKAGHLPASAPEPEAYAPAGAANAELERLTASSAAWMAATQRAEAELEQVRRERDYTSECAYRAGAQAGYRIGYEQALKPEGSDPEALNRLLDAHQYSRSEMAYPSPEGELREAGLNAARHALAEERLKRLKRLWDKDGSIKLGEDGEYMADARVCLEAYFAALSSQEGRK